jgi:chromate transporter
MHRFLVVEQHWLTQAQFNDSIAIAQAAPGPNVLFVALMGWNVGLNAGSMAAALLGVAVTMVGIMLPSTTLTYLAARWGHRNRELLGVRAFKQGMAPVVVGLMVSVGIILGSAHGDFATDWPLWLLSVASGVVIWRTRLHLLWLLAAGAALGWYGLV